MDKIKLPTETGDVEFSYFNSYGMEAVVAMNHEYTGTPFVRVHSSCVFSEAFHTTDCDCALQLDKALKTINKEGGIIIYLYQEGRGIGLKKKIEAIGLQQKQGINTKQAFEILGHEPDPRTYKAAAHILNKLGIDKIKLGTSNPNKIKSLENEGIEVTERVHLNIKTTELIRNYLSEKINILGHHEKD